MAEDIVARLVLQGQQYFSTINQAGQRTQKFQKDTQQGFKSVTGVIQTATKALVAFGAAGIARQIARMINDTARRGDELLKLSQRTGLTVEALNGLTQAAALADVSQEQLSVGLRQLSKNLLDTTRGTGEAKESFKAMGIGGKEAADLLKTPDTAFLEIADRLAKIPDVSVRAAEAMRIVGRSGAEMLPLLNQGRAAIEEQIKAQQRLRPITTEQAKAAEAYNDSLTNLQFAFEGLLQRGIGPLLPHLTAVVEAFTQLVALDIDGFNERIAAMTGEFNVFRGVASLLNSVNTLMKDLAASAAITFELIANPQNYKEIMKLAEEIDKEIREEANRRQSQLFPEATGGKPRDFSAKPLPTAPIDTLPTVTVNEQKKSAELQSLINLREARIKLIQAEEQGLEVPTDRVRILQEEIALLQEQVTIQKEIEAANATGQERAVDETVLLTAQVEKEARLKEIQQERVDLFKKLSAEEQEILGAEAQHEARMQQVLILQQAQHALTQKEADLQRAIAQAGDDQAVVRGGQISLLQARAEFLQKENELYGESVARNKELRDLAQQTNDIRAEGQRLEQEALGRGIVSGASADIERQLSEKQRAVRDAEQQLQLGSIARGQTIEQQRTREIQLIDAKLALLQEEQRLGFISTEQADNQRELLVTQFSNASNPRGFLEGWREAFKQFSGDAEGAFGLAQTLARQFTTGIQTITSSIFQNVFDQLEASTLSWKSALQTIPNILQQITSQLIGMAIAQGVASAIGGGLSGLFGGGGGAQGALNAQARGGLNANLFGPGFASGGSFMVGGPSGTDRTPVSFLASRGERVTVETPDQQRRGGMVVNIINNAGVDISQQERQTPNGNVLDVMIDRRVRRVNRQEFGLNHKPGRVG